MSENQRDAGLVRAIGTKGLAANTINTIVGAGIFATPGALAACMGVYAPFAFLLCAIAIAAVTICFAEGGSRIPTSGGAYGYITAAFGPLAGYVAGTLLWLSNALACGGITAALADSVVNLAPEGYRAPVHALTIVLIIAAVASVNIAGVSRGVRLVDLATTVKMIPLVIFLIAGAGAIHRVNFVQTIAPGSAGLGRALILVLFVLTGMEVSLSASGEVKNPSRAIPRALAIALGVVTLLYIAIQLTAQGILGASLAQSTVPLADAMGRISPALRILMLAGGALSVSGWVASDLLSSPRILFAFARDGMLPRVLGKLHPRTHTPYLAIACYSGIALLLALTGTFAELAVLSTLAVAFIYGAGSLAAWRLAREKVALAGEPLNFPWLGTAVTVATTSMVAFIVMAARAEILGLLAMICLSGTIYLIQSRLLPAAAKA